MTSDVYAALVLMSAPSRAAHGRGSAFEASNWSAGKDMAIELCHDKTRLLGYIKV